MVLARLVLRCGLLRVDLRYRSRVLSFAVLRLADVAVMAKLFDCYECGARLVRLRPGRSATSQYYLAGLTSHETL